VADRKPSADGQWTIKAEEFITDLRGPAAPVPVQDGWRQRLCAKYGLQPQALDGVPPGWQLVVQCALEELRRLGWYTGAKFIGEDHAGLQFELNAPTTPEQDFMCTRMSSWSYHTCCRCGASGATPVPRGRRLETVCAGCHELLMTEDPDGRHVPTFP
jgi:hypothetical protein